MPVKLFNRSQIRQQRAQRRAAYGHRDLGAFDAERRDRRAGLADIANIGRCHQTARQMRRRRRVMWTAERLGHRGDGRRIFEPKNQHGADLLGRRQHLDGELGHDGKGPERTRQQLAHVVSSDVLDHATAGLEQLTPATDRTDTQDMVAGGPRFDASRPGQVARDDAPDCRGEACNAEQRTIIRRLEGQALPMLIEPGPRYLGAWFPRGQS